jgi:hypothetical protein
VTGPGAKSLRNVAECGAVDESLDDSSGGGRLAPEALVGVVETALAEALRVAAEAGQWDLVAQLADELMARRSARATPEPRQTATERPALQTRVAATRR